MQALVKANGGPNDGTLEPVWNEWSSTNGKKGGAAACNDALKLLRRASRISEFDSALLEKDKKLELDFLKLCLGPVSDQLAKRVARLTIDGKIACTAYLTSATRALTARHCLFLKGDGRREKAKLTPVVLDLTRVFIEFGPIDNPRKIRVEAIALEMGKSFPTIVNLKPSTGDVDFAEQRQAENDSMGLLLESNANVGSLEQIFWTGMNFGDRIYLPAYHVSTFLEGLPSEQGFRQQDAGICQVVAKRSDGGRCFQHGCATTQAASGAPVFVERLENGQTVLALIGVHTSGDRKKSGCPGEPALDGVLNFGIAIQEIELDYLQGRR
jgi:hypothetical protein